MVHGVVLEITFLVLKYTKVVLRGVRKSQFLVLKAVLKCAKVVLGGGAPYAAQQAFLAQNQDKNHRCGLEIT